MSREILEATRALAAEEGIAPDRLFEALEDALLSAYKKTPGSAKYARVEMDRETGDFTVYELLIPERLEAQLIVETIDEGTTIDPETGEAREPEDPEIDPVKFQEYRDRVGELVTGLVQQSDSRYTLVQLRERVEALLPKSEQVDGERYEHSGRIKAVIKDVSHQAKG